MEALLEKTGMVFATSARALTKEPTKTPEKKPKIASPAIPYGTGMEYTEIRFPRVEPNKIKVSYNFKCFMVWVCAAKRGKIPMVEIKAINAPAMIRPAPKPNNTKRTYLIHINFISLPSFVGN